MQRALDELDLNLYLSKQNCDNDKCLPPFTLVKNLATLPTSDPNCK